MKHMGGEGVNAAVAADFNAIPVASDIWVRRSAEPVSSPNRSRFFTYCHIYSGVRGLSLLGLMGLLTLVSRSLMGLARNTEWRGPFPIIYIVNYP